MQTRLFVLLLTVVAAFAFAGAAPSAPPPGATALCRDGTYSYSQHHSGTCSHHGGVARWLDGSASSGSPSTPPAPAPAVSRPSNVGTTVLFAKRTRTSGCKLGPNPDRACS